MEIYFFYIGLALFLLSICMAFLLRKYLVRYTISLTSCIDAMLAAKENIEFDEENELLTSKIQVKFRQLYDVLNQQKEASIRDRKQLEEIISDISHQIKTPMSNIKMYSDILKNRELTKEKQREFLGLVQLQIDKLESLIDSMIEMSQMEVGMISVLPKRQPLIKLIEEAVCGIAVKAEKKNMDISILCDERLMACYDLKWTTEALVNILDNAVKYSDENGEIKISVLELGFFIKVQVTDNGKGIEEGNFTQIFKRFYREPEVQQVEGVGIGLFLAQEILKKQKGYVDVKSSPGRGSTFSLYLPFGE
ncbi:MAG: HAMP domain-containing histidine kinase [Lachnospiraceae bacterium]|nr:HAMP domain-containing histidine kinase [Lachnospiraceae bacterium]